MKTDTPDDSPEQDHGGPTDAPYPSGSRPAGPGTEWMTPDNFTSSMEAYALDDVEPALARVREIRARLRSHPALILDFEGVADALGVGRKAVLRDVAHRAPVAVVGDRPPEELRSRVAVEDIRYVSTNASPNAPRPFDDLRPASDRLAAIRHLLADLGNPTPLYLGRGDVAESAFRAVGEAGGIGVIVSPETDQDRATWAEFRLAGPGPTVEFLVRFARALAGDPNP